MAVEVAACQNDHYAKVLPSQSHLFPTKIHYTQCYSHHQDLNCHLLRAVKMTLCVCVCVCALTSYCSRRQQRRSHRQSALHHRKYSLQRCMGLIIVKATTSTPTPLPPSPSGEAKILKFSTTCEPPMFG